MTAESDVRRISSDTTLVSNLFSSSNLPILLQARARGKSRRVTIGRNGVWTPEPALREAGRLIASLKGRDAAPAGRRFAPSTRDPVCAVGCRALLSAATPRFCDVCVRTSLWQMTLKGQWSCLLANYSHIETAHYPLPTLLPRGFDRAPLTNCALCPWWVLVSSLCSRTVAYGWAPKGGRVHGR